VRRRPNKAIPNMLEVDQNLTIGLVQNSSADNYLNWIADLCIPYLGTEVLEIGAGIGDFTSRFAPGRKIHATEVSETSLQSLRQLYGDDERVDISVLDIYQQHDRVYDSVVLINVLEHMEDDVRALEALRTFVRTGGNIVLYVPAFWSLYSNHDYLIGHYRRYRKKELVWLMKQAGFDIVAAKYVNSVGAIGWFLICRVLRRRASEGASVGLMNRMVIPVIRKIESRLSPPFGISVFIVGKRREQ
jgi:2-polyprenyl-3-methyl-5-hydroxy-6-metoxy-1,4-benzoquinol methylase